IESDVGTITRRIVSGRNQLYSGGEIVALGQLILQVNCGVLEPLERVRLASLEAASAQACVPRLQAFFQAGGLIRRGAGKDHTTNAGALIQFRLKGDVYHAALLIDLDFGLYHGEEVAILAEKFVKVLLPFLHPSWRVRLLPGIVRYLQQSRVRKDLDCAGKGKDAKVLRRLHDEHQPQAIRFRHYLGFQRLKRATRFEMT